MTLSYISWLQCALLCDQRGYFIVQFALCLKITQKSRIQRIQQKLGENAKIEKLK